MKTVVVCKHCLRQEYYGALVWYNGQTYCRVCTYDRWERSSDWVRGEVNYTFPLYMDGVDYSYKGGQS